MSLLLDALKKAAEKNAQKEQADLSESTRIDQTEIVDKTVLVDKTVIADQTVVADEVDDLSEDVTVPPFQYEADENITEFELAQIINAQKDKPSGFDASKEKSVNTVNQEEIKPETESHSDYEADLNVDPEPSLALSLEDEDPSLKLALSDEEILLTDDDVTEFLGSDELLSRIDDDGTMTGESNFIDDIDDDSELRLSDKTTTESLNLVDLPREFNKSNNDTTYSSDFTSTSTNAGQTTNLNSLTNDVTTLNAQDQTSTETFASDNYDRTLVKLDGDVSKVFTGMRAVESGAAMTPDFAKKVFVHKSTTLRKRNYKVYALISLILLATIAVLSLFEMQSQMDDIDSSLASLKRNPVPSELRFQRKEKNDENLSVLQGRVDTEALKLLKSLKEKASVASQDENSDESVVAQESNQAEQEANNSLAKAIKSAANEIAPTDENNVAEADNAVETGNVNSDLKQAIEKPIALQNNTNVVSSNKIVKKEIKAPIRIKTKTVISKESLWLREAYAAFEKGDVELAEINYKRVLEKNPKNRDALLGQAAIYAGQNKNSKAIENYQTVLLDNPKDALAMTSLITASTMSPIESESRLKLLHRESPKATYLQFALGNVISAQNRWQEAQQFYFMAHQSEPENPDYAYNLAVSLEQISKPAIALNYYEQAVKNAQNMAASFDVALTEQRIEVLSQ